MHSINIQKYHSNAHRNDWVSSHCDCVFLIFFFVFVIWKWMIIVLVDLLKISADVSIPYGWWCYLQLCSEQWCRYAFLFTWVFIVIEIFAINIKCLCSVHFLWFQLCHWKSIIYSAFFTIQILSFCVIGSLVESAVNNMMDFKALDHESYNYFNIFRIMKCFQRWRIWNGIYCRSPCRICSNIVWQKHKSHLC